jgi:ATP-dependent Lon protease
MSVHFAKQFEEVAKLTFNIRAKSAALKAIEQHEKQQADQTDKDPKS